MRIALLLLALSVSAHASAPTRQISLADYQAQLTRIRQMLPQCSAERTACQSDQIGPDDQISASPAFEVHFDWLRSLVQLASNGKPDDTTLRQQKLADASDRIDAMLRESGASIPPDPNASKARPAADRILAQPEFRHVEELSWWDRVMARFWSWVGDLFSGLSGVGPYVGWLVPVLEWGTLLLACAALLFWVRRVLQRQRLALTLEAPAFKTEWQERSRQWAEAARLAASASDWREAVHALYWASVVELEGRKVWRQHRGRTPREYLRLLDPASPYRQPIQQMTQIFERIWYGLRPAAETDYLRVLALYEAMRTA